MIICISDEWKIGMDFVDAVTGDTKTTGTITYEKDRGFYSMAGKYWHKMMYEYTFKIQSTVGCHETQAAIHRYCEEEKLSIKLLQYQAV